MDNQHQKIKGYRELSQVEIDAMNIIKEHGVKLGVLIDNLEMIEGIDKRWLAMAKSDLQKGIMFAVRSVAQPTTF
jgi:hypothetical protein